MPYLHGVEVVELTTGVRPIAAIASAIIGLIGTAPFADVAKFPLDTPVLITTAAEAKLLTATMGANAAINTEGTLPWAVQGVFDQAKTPIVVVRVATDATPATQQTLIAGSLANQTGAYAFMASQALTGAKPKILAAPGFTHQVLAAGVANAAVVALKSVAASLRSIVVADGTNDTDAFAIAKVTLEGSDRVYMVDPHVKLLDRTGVIVTRPGSAHVAGVIARSDQQRGFWFSPSNQEINGIIGLGRPIQFALSDTSATSNLLNEAGIATIVASNGFRVWGNRTKAVDPLWQFLSVRRTADLIYDAVEASFLWAMDRPISGQLIGDVQGSVEVYLRDLKARGAILGGKAWLDPDLNNEAALKAGRLYVNFDIEPPAPLDRITFQAQREGGYYAEVIAAAATSLTA